MDSWKTLSFVQRGVYHLKDSTDCQDNVCLFENEAYLIAALSDGLGSLKYSSIASKAAVETVCTLFQNADALLAANYNEAMLKQSILEAIWSVIQQRAAQAGVSINDMDCTLVFVCIDKQKQSAIVGQLGDSAICLIDADRSIALSESGALANATSTVMDHKAAEYFSLSQFDLKRKETLGFILTSDGLENEIYTKGSRHVSKTAEPYFNAFFESADPQAYIAKVIEHLTSNPDTPFDDDISLLVLSRAEKPLIFQDDPSWLCSCGARNPLQATYCLNCNMDFSALYQNIKFRDHGGKAAFFEKINRDPVQERIVVETAAAQMERRNKKKAQSSFAMFNFGESRTAPPASEPNPAAAAAAGMEIPVSTETPVQNPESHGGNPANGQAAAPAQEAQPLNPEQNASSVPSGSESAQNGQESLPSAAPAQPEPIEPGNSNAIPVTFHNRHSSPKSSQKQPQSSGNAAAEQQRLYEQQQRQYEQQQRRQREQRQYEQQQRQYEQQRQRSQGQRPRGTSGRESSGKSASPRSSKSSFRTIATVALVTFLLGFILGCITTKSIVSKKNAAVNVQTEQQYQENYPIVNPETETIIDGEDQGDFVGEDQGEFFGEDQGEFDGDESSESQDWVTEQPKPGWRIFHFGSGYGN